MSVTRLDPQLFTPTTGRPIEAGGSVATVRVSGEDTGGAWSLTDLTMPGDFVAAAPPPHTHTREDEGFFVTQGVVSVMLGGQQVEASAGSFLLSPRGQLHTFSNPRPDPARLLILSTPAGLDRFLTELYQQLAADPTDLETILNLFNDYGMRVDLPTG